jgi:SAM-dependent methyltransferase
MRITYRNTNNKEYWENRWEDIPADKPMNNSKIYPLKYSKLAIEYNDGPILEAGCGNGRILRYYHDRGYEIHGFDFIKVAIDKLKEVDSKLSVDVGDITNLTYEDESFKYLLAFGLYHNLENNLEAAIKESYRILQKNGIVCASFRADNFKNRITDWLAKRKEKKISKNEDLVFHKLNLTKKEFLDLFKNNGFEILNFFPVENMPLLYKIKFFRSKLHKNFNENNARSEGYKLSLFGKLLQSLVMKFFPNQFCNVFVVIGKKI